MNGRGDPASFVLEDGVLLRGPGDIAPRPHPQPGAGPHWRNAYTPCLPLGVTQVQVFGSWGVPQDYLTANTQSFSMGVSLFV